MTGEDPRASVGTFSLSEMEGIDRAEEMLDLESLLDARVRRGGGRGGLVSDRMPCGASDERGISTAIGVSLLLSSLIVSG